MRSTICCFLLAILVVACNGGPAAKRASQALDSTGNSVGVPKTHLHDTEVVQGNFVLFLMPDSVRYESYVSDGEEIGEVDADFGVGAVSTLDSLSGLARYKGISATTTEKRYVLV